MQFYFEPDPGQDAPQLVRMVVEIPRDSSNKYIYDPSFGMFRLSRALYSPMHYPGDYGFVPGTIADDHEPLDVLCIVTSASFTGCLTQVRPVAMLDMLDGEETDRKILSVPNRDPRYAGVHSLADLDEHIQREIEHFFKIYKVPEGRNVQMRGWHGIEETHEAIREARARYLESANFQTATG